MVVYCELLLLLCRLLGCEVYFGDVFYLYSRLLERVVKFNDDFGGGLIIVLLIIEI